MSTTSPPSAGGTPPSAAEPGGKTSEGPRRSPGDLLAGGIFVVLGAAFAYAGRTYDIGTAAQPGSGMFPVAAGLLLVGLGVAVLVSGLRGSEYTEGPTRVPWRGMGCVLGALVLFAVVAPLYGLLPATFGCALVSALASPTTTVVKALLTAVGITAGSYVVFVIALQLPIPLFTLPVV